MSNVWRAGARIYFALAASIPTHRAKKFQSASRKNSIVYTTSLTVIVLFRLYIFQWFRQFIVVLVRLCGFHAEYSDFLLLRLLLLHALTNTCTIPSYFNTCWHFQQWYLYQILLKRSFNDCCTPLFFPEWCVQLPCSFCQCWWSRKFLVNHRQFVICLIGDIKSIFNVECFMNSIIWAAFSC